VTIWPRQRSESAASGFVFPPSAGFAALTGALSKSSSVLYDQYIEAPTAYQWENGTMLRREAPGRYMAVERYGHVPWSCREAYVQAIGTAQLPTYLRARL